MRSLSWRQFAAILRKDIVMELRTKEMLTSMTLYTLLTMVIYQIAFTAAGSALDVRLVAGGLIWVAFVFTSMLGLNRSFVHEKDQGVLDALLLSPIDRPVIFFAKAIGNLLFLLIVETISIPVFAFLFLQGRGGFANVGMLALAVLAASIGIAGVGTLLATISVNTKGRDFILALMFLPLMYPLLTAAVQATTIAILGGVGATTDFWRWMGWIGGYDAIMVLAAYGLYEFVIGA